MDQDIDRLIQLTSDMAEAFDQDDLETCASLLSVRESVLKALSARYGLESGNAVPQQLSTTMVTIRELDLALENRLTASMSETSLRINDLQQKTRRDNSGPNFLYLNRRA